MWAVNFIVLLLGLIVVFWAVEYVRLQVARRDLQRALEAKTQAEIKLAYSKADLNYAQMFYAEAAWATYDTQVRTNSYQSANVGTNFADDYFTKNNPDDPKKKPN